MSIAATTSSNLLATTQTAISSSANPTAATQVAIATPAASSTDSVSISAAAQQSSGTSTAVLSQLENQLRQIRGKLNAYEHQVSWQLDNKTAVTGPAGAASSNSSSTSLSATTSGPAGLGELVHTQATSALTADVSLKISGPQGGTAISFAAGTQLSAIAAAVDNVKSSTGVSATLSGNSLKFDSAGSGATQFVTVTAVNGSFDTTSNTSTGATAQTVAAGIASLESGLDLTAADQLTGTQLQQFNTDDQKLGTEETRFQNYIAEHTTPNYASLTHQLGSKINAFEHQVTYHIDNGLPITTSTTAADTTTASTGSNTSTGTTNTSTTATATTTTAAATNTSTGTTLTQSITTGFAALEAQTQQALGSLPSAVAAQFKQLEATLATEETRFTAFATRRFAYQAAQPATGQTQDVSA
jgi:hypothetical protein